MKAIHNGHSFTGLIPDKDTYEKLKNSQVGWKPNTYSRITDIKIPLELFNYLMDRDKSLDNLLSNRSEVK